MKMRRESYQEQKMQQRFQNPPIEMKREERSHFVAATCQQLCHTSANHAKAKMTKKPTNVSRVKLDLQLK